jgi:hypothetical protein
MKKLNEVFKLKQILLFILLFFYSFIFLFFYLLPFSWIYYFLLILNNISYLFLVLFSLNKNIIIKPNKLYWNETPYVRGSYDFKTIFYEIFKPTLLKINEISYSIYYNFTQPRKSFEIKNFEYLAFRYVFPFSINYLDFILNICLNRRLEEEFTKKVWYIRIRLKIKTVLYGITDSISQGISDESKEENLKIRVEFFTLTKNDGDFYELAKQALKTYKPAGIVFRNTLNLDKNTYIIFNKSDMYFSATRSPSVTFWNKDTPRVKVATSLGWYLGKDDQGKHQFQRFLAWKKDLDFDEKFLTRPQMTLNIWGAFKFMDR